MSNSRSGSIRKAGALAAKHGLKREDNPHLSWESSNQSIAVLKRRIKEWNEGFDSVTREAQNAN
jgi:hypothetical protein